MIRSSAVRRRVMSIRARPWQELGGPPVSAPSKRGFGTRLLDVSLRNNDGRVAANFDVQGFQADIHFPMGQP